MKNFSVLCLLVLVVSILGLAPRTEPVLDLVYTANTFGQFKPCPA